MSIYTHNRFICHFGLKSTLLQYFIILFCFSFLTHCTQHSKEKLYILTDPNKTGVTFSNAISIADSLVLPGYEYIYNGGGVAVGDINNDGLQDLYFSGNMVSSTLYLNKSNEKDGLLFEDITAQAGVATKTWANGVVMVDINQDGYKDIYICVGGHQFTPESARSNLLFINNQNGTFSESAAEYGLDDQGYATQSAFFDYDLDGDLDMYLLRNSFVSYSRNTAKPRSLNGESPSTDRLFRNNRSDSKQNKTGGTATKPFTDVSRTANILIEGFGLGVSIADINQDGWPDVYVSNDFITNDLMWINNKDGTFTNKISQYLKHQTFNGMGNDIADFNNDGLPDIIVLDMLPPDNKRWKLTPRGNSYDEFQNGISKGYEPQYVRNTLQLNNGNNTFSEIGQLAGIEATDWSWSSLFVDLDHDGWKDLFITNGYGKDITNLDFIVYGDKTQTMGLDAASVKERQKLLREIPGISVNNFFYQNSQDLRFKDMTSEWTTLKPTFSNGAAYADLDNDGDLELITNNIDEPASIWQSNLNQSNSFKHNHYLRIGFIGPYSNQEGLGAHIKLTHHGATQYQYFNPYKGYLSSMEPFILFGVGNALYIDSIEIGWPDGKQQILEHIEADQTIMVNYKNAKMVDQAQSSQNQASPLFEEVSHKLNLNYQHIENNFVDFKVQPLLPMMHSYNGPGIAVGDVNGDHLEDFYIGSAAGNKGSLFLQQNSGSFIQNKIADMDSISDQMGVLLFDSDQDYDLDLYIVHGGAEQRLVSTYYQDKLFINDGRGRFELSKNILPEILQSGSCISACDFDQDGDLDLFRGSRLMPAAYPTAPKSMLLINEQQNGQTIYKTHPTFISESIGMVTSSLWTDFDNDGWQDLIITGEYMPLTFIHNNKGVLEDMTKTNNLTHTRGWWNSISAGDFDDDGDMDYIAGNWGLNTRFRATSKEPICIYTKDYNQDGTLDPVMCQYVQGVNYLNHTRDILISQITSMRSRFRTYSSYANATFETSLSSEEIADAYVVKAEDFESKYIENVGQGKFKMYSLPMQSQFAPIFGINIEDWDSDGLLDVILVGNSYAMEVITGRADAHPGLFLKGNGLGQFTVVPLAYSGFTANRDAKGLANLMSANKHRVILVANNNGPIEAFQYRLKQNVFYPDDGDLSALLTLQNNKKRKYEFYHGSTYLSNGTHCITLPIAIQKLEVINNKRQVRTLNPDILYQ